MENSTPPLPSQVSNKLRKRGIFFKIIFSFFLVLFKQMIFLLLLMVSALDSQNYEVCHFMQKHITIVQQKKLYYKFKPLKV